MFSSPDSHRSDSSPLPSPQDGLLHRMTLRIRRSLELHEILEAAVSEVRSFLGTDRVSIYRFHPDEHGEVIAESVRENTLPSLLGFHFPAEDIPVESRLALLQSRHRVVVDVAQQSTYREELGEEQTADYSITAIAQRPLDACHAAYLSAMGIQSALTLPIVHQDHLWGLLVSHHIDPYPYTREQLDVVQLVVDQLVIAIAQSTLLAEARHKAEQQATINHIATCLHPLTELDLTTALHHAVDALHCAGGRLYQLDPVTQAPVLYAQGIQPTLPVFLQESILEQHILWREYFRPSVTDLEPTTYALNDLYAEPRLRALMIAFRETPIRGLLVVPLVYRQDFWGYLTLFRNEMEVERTWAGNVAATTESDHRQLMPRTSFAAWKETKRGQSEPWSTADQQLAQMISTQFAATFYEYDLYQRAQLENRQRQQVEMTLRRQAQEERLRYAILQRIRQSLDLHTILDTTVAEVRQFLSTDRVLIYQFEPGWSGRVVAESVSSRELSIFGQVIYDPCFSEKQQYKPYQQGRVSQITNIHELSLMPCYFNLLNGLQVQANLVVPILMSHWEESATESPIAIAPDATSPKLWGLLIAHNCVAPREWQPWEVSFLQQLAVQVAIALNQAELYQQVQALNADLEQQVQARTSELRQSLAYEALLKRITDKVRDSLDETQIMQTAVEELTYGLQVLCCDAALYDLEERLVTVCYEHFQNAGTSAIGLTVSIDDWLELYNLLFSGIYCQFCMLPNAPVMLRQMPQPYTILACPMSDDQGALGNIWLFKPSSEYFVDLEIRLVRQVANQCAIALRQARLYQSAQAQVEELARLNHLKDDFLSTVSHELRTPMSNIKMATQMLELILMENQEPTVTNDKASQYFQILNTECKREIDLINDLLDLTRLDAQAEPLSPIEIDLAMWIPHVAESFAMRMHEQQQHSDIWVSPDLPMMTTDLSCLERILSELLNNACKYTPAGESITITCQARTEQHIEIRITNTGVEIAEIERDRVFDKFYRIPNNDPWKYGGTGLGLALVKKLTEYIHGSIHVETAPNATSFVVILPARLPSLPGES